MTGKIIVITGAGTGIGQATAIRFGSLGWRVAIGGRRTEKLAETAERIAAGGGTCFARQLDVADGESVEGFFDAVETELGPVEVTPSAPVGPLPETYDQWGADMAAKFAGG